MSPSAIRSLGPLAFVVGAAGLALNQSWWRSVTVAAAAFSGVVYLVLWNGKLQRLDQQGLVGLLIDAAIIAVVAVARWS